ncbi:MAG: hypothetical protein ACYC7D_02615 [Nitrososphaerales archaeon]
MLSYSIIQGFGGASVKPVLSTGSILHNSKTNHKFFGTLLENNIQEHFLNSLYSHSGVHEIPEGKTVNQNKANISSSLAFGNYDYIKG